MTQITGTVALLFILCVATSSPLRAQIHGSELQSISQTIDGTKFTVTYSRPRMRGRDSVFGNPDVVPWGRVWTPGANWATTLEVNRPVHIAGHAVKAGIYSVWMVTRPSHEWTLVLDPEPKRHHSKPPDSTSTQVRARVKSDSGPFTEVLTWSFPDIRANGASLVMQWSTARVVLDLSVEPSMKVGISASEAAPYVGRYIGPPERGSLNVSYENGTLKAEWDPENEYLKRFALLPIAPDKFVGGLYDGNGELFEVIGRDYTVVFTKRNGRAVRVKIRNENGVLYPGLSLMRAR